MDRNDSLLFGSLRELDLVAAALRRSVISRNILAEKLNVFMLATLSLALRGTEPATLAESLPLSFVKTARVA